MMMALLALAVLDHLTDPWGLTSDIKVVSSIASASLYNWLSIEHVRTDSVDQDGGLLHQIIDALLVESRRHDFCMM
jgi:hypothetical protein